MPSQIESAILDGNGAATIRLSPAPLLRYWTYSYVAVSISTGQASAPNGNARLYKGEVGDGKFVSGTRTPWEDTAGLDDKTGRLTSPEHWTIQFVACDPGAVATVTAEFDEAPI